MRRRERGADGRRVNRFLVSYNDTELSIVREAAARDSQALAAWVGNAALDVAKERVVPVSADARDVVAEFIKARNHVSRVGNNVNQIAKALNADGTVTAAQLAAALDAVHRAIQRMDEATRQVMRERRPRS
ncbi:plasmid mobilization relaxosome protein MobC [Wenjunlia tyrosinilytica]|uniref:plasmid mobilization relaxosome protein MobC n=1 Tax=Wenjunlia tyrosinilytica TaxID=1544741 RepID=UPI00166F2B8C|nr:plasmid mobilization relaxosome protein MobC [Wenjunlia tyrosinilytica]